MNDEVIGDGTEYAISKMSLQIENDKLRAENQKLRESRDSWRSLAYTARNMASDSSRYYGGGGEDRLEAKFCLLEQQETKGVEK